MRDKKSTDSRRKLLKSIAAGSGAIVAGKSLPESWSKPVINTIVLPAHAETTAQASPEPSCDKLVYSGFTLMCPAGGDTERHWISVDENGPDGCPSLVVSDTLSVPDGYWFMVELDWEELDFAEIKIFGNGDDRTEIRDGYTDCDIPEKVSPSDNSGNFDVPLLGSDDNPWHAVGSVIATDGLVTLSNIVFSPV